MFDSIPFFLLSPKSQKRVRDMEDRARKERIARNKDLIRKGCKDWSPNMPFEKQLALSTDSFTTWQRPYLLFPDLGAAISLSEDQFSNDHPRVESPSGELAYVHNLLPAARRLSTCSGNRKGWVVWDGDVAIPMLVTLRRGSYSIWMSTTPQEVFSLRAGTKKAKGHTIIAGLGLGYQLIEASKKRSVKKITLVEINQELIDWLLPVIRPKLGEVELEVICDCAREVLPKLSADVALVDIFRSYGHNALWRECPRIDTVWCWGSVNASLGGR